MPPRRAPPISRPTPDSSCQSGDLARLLLTCPGNQTGRPCANCQSSPDQQRSVRDLAGVAAHRSRFRLSGGAGAPGIGARSVRQGAHLERVGPVSVHRFHLAEYARQAWREARHGVGGRCDRARRQGRRSRHALAPAIPPLRCRYRIAHGGGADARQRQRPARASGARTAAARTLPCPFPRPWRRAALPRRARQQSEPVRRCADAAGGQR